jgi:hypothetical protein
MNFITEKENKEINKKDTFVRSKISHLFREIEKSTNEISTARDNAIKARNDYNRISAIHFIKRHKQRKKLENAKLDIQIANSNVSITIMKIVRDSLEIILLCFALPMDLIQKMGQWVATGFSKRDEKLLNLTENVTKIAKRK